MISSMNYIETKKDKPSRTEGILAACRALAEGGRVRTRAFAETTKAIVAGNKKELMSGSESTY